MLTFPAQVAIWFKTALHGVNIRYPQNEGEFKFYKVFESATWGNIIAVGTWCLIIGPFIAKPFCDYGEREHYLDLDDGFKISRGGIALGTLSVLYTIIVGLQWVDVWLWIKSTSWETIIHDKTRLNMDKTHIWCLVRMICSTALFIDCATFFFFAASPRVTRCLSPIILISRRENLKIIMEGFFMSFRQSLPVLRVLFVVLVLWACVGFFCFRNIVTAGAATQPFASYGTALLTCLHCYASRPTVLYRLNPLWEENDISALYFVFLTVFADIIIGSFILAVGNRYYRDFSALSFRKRLKYRRNALLAIFHLFADGNPGEGLQRKISLQRWLEFCQRMPTRFDMHTK